MTTTGAAPTGAAPQHAGATGEGPTMRQRLRAQRALAGTAPAFDTEAAPPDPVELFTQWFVAAVEAGVPEPHVMSVATAGGDGVPGTRMVVLADVAGGCWSFATDARSRKAQDLTVNPQVELGFWWQPLARQVRVAGTARLLPELATAADFLARSPGSRAAALGTRPGEPLVGAGVLAAAMVDARVRVDAEPDLVLPQWQVWLVEPSEVEFWQGDPGRAHTRLVYRRAGQDWSWGLVWP